MLQCSNYGRLIPNEASFLARRETISDDCLYRAAPFIDNGANAPGRARQRHLTHAGPGPRSPSSPDLSLFPLTRQREIFRSKMGYRFLLADTIAPVTAARARKPASQGRPWRLVAQLLAKRLRPTRVVRGDLIDDPVQLGLGEGSPDNAIRSLCRRHEPTGSLSRPTRVARRARWP